MAYIAARKTSRCIFCVKPTPGRDAANLVLHRGVHGFVMMNLFPYNSGHLMVAPYGHLKTLDALSSEASLELLQLTALCIRALQAGIHPEGFNIGMNLGRVSGAGIDDHLHLHIVPRWNGDTNFMPLFAETRVIPEHLQQTYRKLLARFRSLKAPGPTAPTRSRRAKARLPQR
jgi:ATP adenylyltransferase